MGPSYHRVIGLSRPNSLISPWVSRHYGYRLESSILGMSPGSSSLES